MSPQMFPARLIRAFDGSSITQKAGHRSKPDFRIAQRSMTKEQINAVGFCIVGSLLLLTNKPFGELCRQWQIVMFRRDYGMWSFRVPIITIGALVLLIGIGFFFF
jgi:hypothetical protein